VRKGISTWPALPGFCCRHCGDAARQNPDDLREWGCARCNGATHSVALSFDITDPAAAGLDLAPGVKLQLADLAAMLADAQVPRLLDETRDAAAITAKGTAAKPQPRKG